MPENRKQFLHCLGNFNRVGSRLSLDAKDNGPADEIRRFRPACGLIVLNTVHDTAQILETDRGSTAVDDNELSKIGGVC